MKRGVSFSLSWLGIFGVFACTETPTPPPLRSLRASGESSLVCLATGIEVGGETRDVFEPRPLSSCPDYRTDDGETRRLHALVTQTETGEVALVNLEAAEVVDSEVAIPGISFVPVGAEPVSIVTTPGGEASFVATREPGKEALYALPTRCVATRGEDQPVIDITSFPACRLPAAPGFMEIVLDRVPSDAGEPMQRKACGERPQPLRELMGASEGAKRTDCPADLAQEFGEPGRRKILLALPTLGELRLYDAQELLDAAPGSFDECQAELTVELSTVDSLETLPQPLPSDLEFPSGCELEPSNLGPPGSLEPHPIDATRAGDTLYVADLDAPVIHRLDVGQACAIEELSPLRPQSLLAPGAVIRTRRVAVSPLTSERQRFLYAIEESNTTTAGSVMVFDVSEGATQVTPLVRPGSELIVQEAPDRIQFASEADDIEFVENRFPVIDPVTGVALEGVHCDPSGPGGGVGAEYRPNSDLSEGAGPTRLRGVFAAIALHNGQVAVVDVEDLDAPCRRPAETNPEATANFRGCAEDPNRNFSGTVSDELSCRVVEPHRARSGNYFVNDTRLGRAASLRQFPRLTSGIGRLLPTDQSEEGKQNPILLGVDFPGGEPAQVFVGSNLLERDSEIGSELSIDPGTAERSSVVLSLLEPRVFLPNEQFSLTYEGSIGISAFSRLDRVTGGALLEVDDGPNGRFCSRGVEDVSRAREVGAELLPGAGDAELQEFAAQHADYVQITGDFPKESSDYWTQEPGLGCGEQLVDDDSEVEPLTGVRFCELWFGTSDVPTTRRDLRIREAYESRLLVEPRRGRQSPELLLELVSCCFPEPTEYRVRAGKQWVLLGSERGFVHPMAVEADSRRCIASCNPFDQQKRGRAFEIACRGDCGGEDGLPVIGLARDGGEEGRDLACVFPDQKGPLTGAQAETACVFRGLHTHFALYRGRDPSLRDMRFSWQLRGGFVPFSINIAVQSSPTIPGHLRSVPGLGALLVTSSTTGGLTRVSLDDLTRATIN